MLGSREGEMDRENSILNVPQLDVWYKTLVGWWRLREFGTTDNENGYERIGKIDQGDVIFLIQKLELEVGKYAVNVNQTSIDIRPIWESISRRLPPRRMTASKAGDFLYQLISDLDKNGEQQS